MFMSKKSLTLLMILIASLLCINQDACSQTVSGRQKMPVFFSLYAEGGWTSSSFRSSNESVKPKFSPISSFALGAGINMRFIEKTSKNRFAEDGLFALQAGVLYTQSGFKADDEKVTGDYVCVPISFQFYPISNLYVEFVTEMWMNVKLSPKSAMIQGLNINLDKHKANDFKYGVGVGYCLPIAKHSSIGISAKYLFGSSDFAKNLPWKGNQRRISVFYRMGL